MTFIIPRTPSLSLVYGWSTDQDTTHGIYTKKYNSEFLEEI